jgi:hypothetical protein
LRFGAFKANEGEAERPGQEIATPQQHFSLSKQYFTISIVDAGLFQMAPGWLAASVFSRQPNPGATPAFGFISCPLPRQGLTRPHGKTTDSAGSG